MAARKAALLAMAKMALVDGNVSDLERAMLAPLLTNTESVDELLEEAKTVELSALVAQLDRYADRFFVALRSASMAHVDAHLDAREAALYDELIASLDLSPEDKLLIDESVAGLSQVEPPPIHPRIAQLFQQSSFV
jgi:hypothetical protein